ncbi:metal-sensing transcriptional repressor, partial [Leptospira kirschneri]
SSKSEFDGVSRGLLKSHIRTCVTERIRGNDSKILEEFIRTIGYVLR